MQLVTDAGLKSACESFGIVLNIRDVEKSFVNGDLFHETSDIMQSFHHLS